MAAVDPYRLCPCGSGEKYKWCCQKIEAQAEKVQRLIDSGQFDGALAACEDGLKLDPCNPLLSLRKAMILGQRKDLAASTEVMNQLLAKHPKHPGALEFRLRLTILDNNPFLAVVLLQEALGVLDEEHRSIFAHTTEVLASQLFQVGRAPAGIEHLALAIALDPENSGTITSTYRNIESNSNLSLWLRNHYRLTDAPENLDPSLVPAFNQGMEWAEGGLWGVAAASFDTISAESPEADRNSGLCLLWLGDHQGAIESLRRYIGQAGPTTDAIDLESLCQLIAPIPEEDRVDMLQWIWPIRDRKALQTWLDKEPLVQAEGSSPIDPSDPKSPEVQVYLLLNKPVPDKDAIHATDDVPLVQGRLLVGSEIAAIEAYDNGRLDRLSDWFRDSAGAAIPPAHPKTKRVGKASRVGLALQAERLFPKELPVETAKKINRQEAEKIVQEIWPNLPMPALNQHSPLEAAKHPELKLKLMAAIRLLELSGTSRDMVLDTTDLRQRLGLEADPELPADSNLNDVHLSRLHLLPVEKLDDEPLVELLTICHRFQILPLLERTAHELLKRPAALEQEAPGIRLMLFSDLSNLALGNNDPAGALAWIERGRTEEPAAQRQANALNWDIIELRLRSTIQPPEAWVPFLASVMDRYGKDQDSSTALLSVLVQMRLVQAVPSPDRPGEVYLDTRTLQALLAKFGPRITTASGELGVSASRPNIWTPGAETGKAQTGGLWTPGSGAATKPEPTAGEKEKPKIIIPGR